MPLSFSGGSAERGRLYADAAAAIPGVFLSKGNLTGAARALDFLAKSTGEAGMIPVSARNGAVDPMANLWFIRAAHLFAQSGDDRALAEKWLLLSKRILQDFIVGRGLGGVKMDDGGLLLTPPHQPAEQGLRLNALWYSALETTAGDLKARGDKGADHFERLAGRFRRAFAKSYWCEGHNRVCPPYRRTLESHGEILDVEQLLLTILPESPIPRTKQRQLLQLARAKSLTGAGKGAVGVMVDHPTLGRVESLLHRAWLAVGILNTAENPAAVADEARAVMAPLQVLAEQGGASGLPAYYRDGRPLAGLPVDALTTAEVRNALERVKGSS